MIMGIDIDIQDIEVTFITCIHKSWFFEKIPKLIASIYIPIVFCNSLNIYTITIPVRKLGPKGSDHPFIWDMSLHTIQNSELRFSKLSK